MSSLDGFEDMVIDLPSFTKVILSEFFIRINLLITMNKEKDKHIIETAISKNSIMILLKLYKSKLTLIIEKYN